MSTSPSRSSAIPESITDLARTLGQNIADARLRRGWTQEMLASKIGTSRLTVQRAERGNVGTGIGVYLSALWAMGLEGPVRDLASLNLDPEGALLARRKLGERARPELAKDDDF